MALELFPWQREHAERIRQGLTERGIFLDTSETGTGKTYVAAWAAGQNWPRMLVVTLKSVCTAWRRVLATCPNVDVLAVTNVEQLKLGKLPYVAISTDPADRKGKRKLFTWVLPENTLVVFDECQGYGGVESDNARLFASLCMQRRSRPDIRILALSATPFDSPLKCRALGFALGWHTWTKASFYNWALRHGCYRSPWHNGIEFGKGPRAQEGLENIKEALKPWTSRLRVSDIPGFLEGVVEPTLIDLDRRDLDEVNEMYAGMSMELLRGEQSDNPLVIGLRARQKSEWLKAPWLLEETAKALEEGRSVAIFCSFDATLDWLHKVFLDQGTPVSEIRGGQSETFRQEQIDKFQTDKSIVCLCNIASGGIGVSLHHTETSQRPRTTLITPSFRAEHLVQTLGRTARAGSLSKPLQRIVLAADTIEEEVFDALVRKLGNFDRLLDSDLTGLVQADQWEQLKKGE
jgi:hypothetical protein